MKFRLTNKPDRILRPPRKFDANSYNPGYGGGWGFGTTTAYAPIVYTQMVDTSNSAYIGYSGVSYSFTISTCTS